jgi:hypothetical protein
LYIICEATLKHGEDWITLQFALLCGSNVV